MNWHTDVHIINPTVLPLYFCFLLIIYNGYCFHGTPTKPKSIFNSCYIPEIIYWTEFLRTDCIRNDNTVCNKSMQHQSENKMCIYAGCNMLPAEFVDPETAIVRSRWNSLLRKNAIMLYSFKFLTKLFVTADFIFNLMYIWSFTAHAEMMAS